MTWSLNSIVYHISYIIFHNIAGWWFQPLGKNMHVRLDHHPNYWGNIIHVPNHQPDRISYIMNLYPLHLPFSGCSIFGISFAAVPSGRLETGWTATKNVLPTVEARATQRDMATRPGKHTKNDGKSQFLMGKSTISMAIFNSFLYVYQRLTRRTITRNWWTGAPVSLLNGIPTPQNMSQLGWWNSQKYGNSKNSCSKPPTR